MFYGLYVTIFYYLWLQIFKIIMLMAMAVWTPLNFPACTHMILCKPYFRIWHISWALENIPHLAQLLFCATAMTICHFNWPFFFLLRWQNLSICFTFCIRKIHSLKTCPPALESHRKPAGFRLPVSQEKRASISPTNMSGLPFYLFIST